MPAQFEHTPGQPEIMTVNMGPSHPATHGVLRIVLQLDGDEVVRAVPHIGYLHLAPLAFLIGVLPGVAQPEASAPPKILQIFREEVKVGKTAAHQKVEAGWPKAFAQVKWPTYYLAATSMTGPAEAWYMTGYPSYAAYEADQQNLEKATALFAETQRLSALDGELLTQGRGKPLGLLVDEVLGVVDVDPQRIAPMPALATVLSPALFRGLVGKDDRVIILVSEDGLGDMTEVVNFSDERAKRPGG